jgi:hypothetical protein
MKTLQECINELYAAFSDVPAPKHVDGCPCCVGHRRIPQLLSSSLREIAPDDLAPYAFSAILTVGEVSDYLYFFPRIVEVSVIELSWWPDIEVTAKKMRETNFGSWPPWRKNAFEAVLAPTFHHLLQAGQYCDLGGWLCACGNLELDVRPYLAAIGTVPEAVLSYFEDNEPCLKARRLCRGSWDLPNAAHDQIVEWFYSPQIRRIPSEAYGYAWPESSEPGVGADSR